MPTVTTSATPYCTVEQLFLFVDWRIVADAVRDDDDAPRPLRATLLDDTSDQGALLVDMLLTASGTLESACLARTLYTVADLAALTGATAKYLQQVVAGLTVWNLFGRRAPAAGKPDEIPAVRAASDALERLGRGETIFGLADQRTAGVGPTTITQDDVVSNNQRYTVTAASRYFGVRGSRGGLYNGCN